MRDDIHKLALLLHAWQKVMRFCAREADRGERTRAAARTAILADINSELSANFISKLREIASEKQRHMFNDISQISPGAGDEGSVLEGQICESFLRHTAVGCSPEDAAIASVEDVLNERIRARARAMTGHWMTKAGDDQAKAAVVAMKVALQAIDCQSLAVKTIFSPTRAEPRVSEPFDLDENLLAPK